MKIWLFAFSYVQSIMHFFMPRGNKSNIKAEKRKNHFVIFFLSSWAGGILQILQYDWLRERAVFSPSGSLTAGHVLFATIC